MLSKDVINIINDEYIKNGFDKRFLIIESLGLLSLAGIPFDDNLSYLSLFAFSVVLTEIANYYKCNELEYKMKDYIAKNEAEYGNLEKLYNEYVSLVSNIISKYQFRNNMDLCNALNYLLHDGIFSLNEHKYRIHKNTFGETYDIRGSYVIQGDCCCRHNTKFMSDLLTKLDVPNFNINVSTKLFRRNSANHVLNGIFDNGKLFGYDFTNNVTLDINLDKYYLEGDILDKAPFYLDEMSYVLYNILSFDKFNGIDDIYKYETPKFDLEEKILSKEIGEDIARFIKQDLEIASNFNVMKSLKEEISHKSLVLVPR